MARDDSIDVRPGRLRAMPWEKFKAEVLALYAPGQCAAGTARQMAAALELAGSVAGEDGEPMVRTTADLTVALIARIVATRPPEHAPHTTWNLLRKLARACNLAVRSGRLRVSPFALKPVKKWVAVPPPAGKRHLSRAELGTLLARLAAEEGDGRKGWKLWKARRIRAMVAVAAHTGLRASELFRLHVEDVDLAARIIHVRPRGPSGRLKTANSAAPVPMPAALVPIVEAWLSHRLDPPCFPPPEQVPWLWPGCRGRGPWTAGPPGAKPLDVLKAVAGRAGIAGVTWQALRRSLATHLEAAGLGGAMIARILRHTEEVDRKYYRHADADNLRGAVEGFSL